MDVQRNSIPSGDNRGVIRMNDKQTELNITSWLNKVRHINLSIANLEDEMVCVQRKLDKLVLEAREIEETLEKEMDPEEFNEEFGYYPRPSNNNERT
jgi:hypothetical protein